jgi:hypothetical protein
MEQYTWLIILAAWSLLLALGLAGGDPLAVGQPGREAPAIKLVKWAHRTTRDLRTRGAGGRDGQDTARARRYPAPARPSESGLHAAV